MDNILKVKSISIWIFIIPFCAVNACLILITEFHSLVMEFLEWNNSFISNNIKSMTEEELKISIKYENKIDDIRNQLIDSSGERLSKGLNPKAELLFTDVIKHLEHVGDYSLNISQALEQIN